MNHIIKILFLSLLVSGTINSYAQSHTFMPGWCRFSKPTKGQVKGESAIFQCKVCDDEKEKEWKAKKTEDKRRADVAAANYKAKVAAAKIASDLKKAEDLKYAHSGEVLINGPKTVPSKTTISKKAESIKLENHYLYSNTYDLHSLYYLNELNWPHNNKNMFVVNGDTIFTKNEFKRCSALPLVSNINHDPENKLNFPPNIGIVVLNKEKILVKKYDSGETYEKKAPVSDIVDAKGNRLINDDAISGIIHFAGDYFLLFKGEVRAHGYPISHFSFDDAAIFNYKTKELHALRKVKYHGKWVDVAIWINSTRVSEGVAGEKLRKKGDYKAFFLVQTAVREFIVYYITNDGKIEEQEIN